MNKAASNMHHNTKYGLLCLQLFLILIFLSGLFYSCKQDQGPYTYSFSGRLYDTCDASQPTKIRLVQWKVTDVIYTGWGGSSNVLGYDKTLDSLVSNPDGSFEFILSSTLGIPESGFYMSLQAFTPGTDSVGVSYNMDSVLLKKSEVKDLVLSFHPNTLLYVIFDVKNPHTVNDSIIFSQGLSYNGTFTVNAVVHGPFTSGFACSIPLYELVEKSPGRYSAEFYQNVTPTFQPDLISYSTFWATLCGNSQIILTIN